MGDKKDCEYKVRIKSDGDIDLGCDDFGTECEYRSKIKVTNMWDGYHYYLCTEEYCKK